MPKRRQTLSSPKRNVNSARRAPEAVQVVNMPRRSSRHTVSPPTKGPKHSLSGMNNFQGRTRRSRSMAISISNSSSSDDDLIQVSPKENASSKHFRVFGFLTPVASPNSFFNGYSDTVASEGSIGFLSLPIEVHQHICIYLTSDQDIANYARLCTTTKEYITDSVWRKCFLRNFDPIEHATPRQLRFEYEERRRISRCEVYFRFGSGPLHWRCLALLRNLIIQSNAHECVNQKGAVEVHGLNHTFLRNLVTLTRYHKYGTYHTNIVDAICRTDASFETNAEKSSQSPKSLLLIIQLCLLHISLSASTCSRAAMFHHSQQQVYKCYSEEPIFKGRNNEDINLPWLLHVANFFKFHFKQPCGEGILTHRYLCLSERDRIKPWCGRLKPGTQELGKRWKGAYAYLDEEDLEAIRDRNDKERYLVVDETCEGNNGLQDIVMFFDISDHPQLHFSNMMEERLHGRPLGPLCDHLTGEASIPETKDFFGLGDDGNEYHFHGRIHAMPPQQGIPGFQRITMMKCLPDENGVHGLGRTSWWAYEGCVLPGNMIMVGRWWRVESNPADQVPSYSGPFICWRVDEDAEDVVMDVTVALKFMADVQKAMVN